MFLTPSGRKSSCVIQQVSGGGAYPSAVEEHQDQVIRRKNRNKQSPCNREMRRESFRFSPLSERVGYSPLFAVWICAPVRCDVMR